MQEQSNIKHTVLLVEDDPLLVKMYQTKFTMEGFNVLIAGDGLQGLALAQENKIDCMILDIMMPKLSGIDMYQKVRALGLNPPTIFLTNLTQGEDAKKAIELGAKEYLIKANLTPGEIVLKIKSYLGSAS